MGRDWFVKPETIRLELPDGEWAEVKKELNYGEIRRFKQIAGLNYDEARTISSKDLDKVSVPLILAYVVDWSVSENGKKQEVSEEAIDLMRAGDVYEMVMAILMREKKMKAKKKTTKRKPQSSATT